jgi:probable HAF family extracellular repeat protein
VGRCLTFIRQFVVIRIEAIGMAACVAARPCPEGLNMFVIRRLSAKRFARRSFAAVFISFAMFALGGMCRAGISYTLTDVGTLPRWPSASPTAINDAGQVTGHDYSSMPYETTFLYSNGTLRDLGGNFGGAPNAGLGINNLGQVVGFVGILGSNDHAFLYSNGTTVNLAPAGMAHSGASGINDKGQIVGYITTASSQIHAALFSDGTFQDLGALTPAGSSATAINQSGEIIGDSLTASGRSHAVLWAHGAIEDLGTLGGAYGTSYAEGINATGQIVGGTDTGAGEDPFLYSNGVMHDLGNLPGARMDGSATGINDAGEIVGGTRDEATQHSAAFLYADGTMYDLNDLLTDPQGYQLTWAAGINNSGQIVASATTPSGAYHVVLLTPAAPLVPAAVPLPPADWAALATLPLLLLVVVRERKRACPV